MAFRCTIPVRFGECDHAAIVYYPRIFHFCHVAMEELFAEVVGVPYDRVILEERVGYPTVKLEAEFTKPVAFGAAVEMTVRVERLGERSVDFRFEGRVAGETAFVVRSRSVAVDMNHWASVPIPEEHRARLETLRD